MVVKIALKLFCNNYIYIFLFFIVLAMDGNLKEAADIEGML